ncbi:hypothetical protein [Streptacidiphilus cavernicola]|uniref:4Fe-4S ferredoxin-type domain-containing protein n=1 Tax=Streptacidiphilus cavernicola TaxID=3342716 RepID=A0ABV6W451_9ACTN
MTTVWVPECGNERYMAWLGVQVDPWNLDECRECEFCGGCAVHTCYRDDKSTLLHADWFMPFPAHGEPECGEMGGPAHLVPASYPPEPCNLAPDHGGKHRTRAGWSWPQTSAAPVVSSVAGPDGGTA